MSGANRLDQWADDITRSLARRSSRRGFVARLGTWLAGAVVGPVLLPVARGQASEENGLPGEEGDPKDCSYWRYCASNGPLCSCCGGAPNQCPPGTVMSAMAWIGTCRNPVDGRNYLIAYHDCCGKPACTRCYCARMESEMPVYRIGQANDVHWCSANESAALTCTTAIVLGPAEPDNPTKAG